MKVELGNFCESMIWFLTDTVLLFLLRVTFVKEFVYHALFPLSLPLIYLWEGGMVGVLNRQFWGSRLSVSQWLLSICCESLPDRPPPP